MDSEPIRVPPHDPWITTLENGMELLLREEPEAPVISLQVWVRCGSIHEDEHLGAGLSHLLEHMLFNGTEKRGAREVSADVQAAGAYINAYTSFDRTVYWIETPPSGLSDCIDILGDMILHSTLPDEEFRKELDVIRREMAMSDDSPSAVASKLLFATTFQQHPCRHPIIGYRQVFDQIAHAQLVDFYRKQYVPNNLFLVASGPFQREELAGELERVFGSAPRAARAPVILPTEPPQQGPRSCHRSLPAQHSHLRLAWHGAPATHRDTASLDLLTSILGAGRSSRLYRSLRDELGLVHSISAHLHAMSDLGLVVIGAETDPDKRAAAETAIQEQLTDFIETGPTREEQDKAVKNAVSDTLRSLTTTRGQAGDIASSWLLTGNADFTGEYIEQLQSVTETDLQDCAARYLQPTRKSTASANPASETPRESAAEKTARRPATTERVVLSNGLTLLLRRDVSLPLVTIHGAFRAGLLAEPPGKAGLTRLVSELLAKDTRARSAFEVASSIESVGGHLSTLSGYNSLGVTTEVMAPDWRLGLELLADAICEPLFLEPTLERERESHLADIRAEKDRPLIEALKALREQLFPAHPYRNPISGTLDSIRSVTADDCRRLREAHLTGTNGVLTLYGDLDPSTVRDEVEARLAGLPPGRREFRDAEPAPSLGKPVRLVHSSEKEQAVVVIGFPGAPLSSPDVLPLELVSDGCSDMSSRLFVRVREELGAAYSVGASRMHGFCGGTFFFYASTAPHQVEIVEETLNEEIDRLVQHGFSDGELGPIRQSWHGSHLNRLQTVAAQARIHTLDELYDFGWNHSAELPQRVEQMRSADIVEVCRKYFQEDRKATIIRTPDA